MRPKQGAHRVAGCDVEQCEDAERDYEEERDRHGEAPHDEDEDA
jgi:hypothetical protein